MRLWSKLKDGFSSGFDRLSPGQYSFDVPTKSSVDLKPARARTLLGYCVPF